MLSRNLCPAGQDLPTHVAALAFGMADSGARADLGGLTVLLPSAALGPDVRAAVARAGAAHGFATVVPPRMLTLETLLDEVMLAHPVVPRARRLADLHRLLVSRGWFGGTPQWDTCRAILSLADELSARLPEPRIPPPTILPAPSIRRAPKRAALLPAIEPGSTSST